MGDAELVALAVGGDRDAFAALYDQHAPGVGDFLRRMLGNPHDAADALQDTFIAAGSRLHQLRDPAKFRPWLYAIARRHAYSATSSRSTRRQRDAELPEDELVIAAPEVDPTDALADEELGRLVDAAAEGLDERDQAVLHLHFRQGLSGDELAAALGVERNNAHVLVHRVRERLQTSIGALLVARHGRPACSQLDAILGGWDGTLSTVVRKRINRHAEGCSTCGEVRSNAMKPAALLGLIPLAPLPASAREAVLDRVELCSYDGEPWPGDDGFPPGDDRPVDGGDDDGRGRARRVLVSAVLALLVFLLAGSVVLADADRVDRGVLGPTTTTSEESTSTTERATTTSESSSTTTIEPGVTATTRRGSTTPTTRRPSTTPTTRRPGAPPPPTTTPTTPPTSGPTTTEPPATTATTRVPSPTTTQPPRTTTTQGTTIPTNPNGEEPGKP